MRARRSSTGSTLAPSATGPACRIEEPAQVVGEPVEAEVGARHGRVVVVEAARPGGGSPRPGGRGRAGSNHRKPRARSSSATGYGPDGDRAPVDGRLDRRVAEALPRRRERDRVAGRVGVRHRPGRRLVEHAAPGPGEDAAQRRPRSRPRPDRAASRWRRAPRPAPRRRARPFVRSRAPGGARAARRRLHAERGSGRVAIARRARRRRSRCRWSWPGCPGRRISSSVRRLIVTWRQAGSTGGSSVTWAHCGALPRRVVVVQHRRPAPEARGHRPGRR